MELKFGVGNEEFSVIAERFNSTLELFDLLSRVQTSNKAFEKTMRDIEDRINSLFIQYEELLQQSLFDSNGQFVRVTNPQVRVTRTLDELQLFFD